MRRRLHRVLTRQKRPPGENQGAVEHRSEVPKVTEQSSRKPRRRAICTQAPQKEHSHRQLRYKRRVHVFVCPWNDQREKRLLVQLAHNGATRDRATPKRVLFPANTPHQRVQHGKRFATGRHAVGVIRRRAQHTHGAVTYERQQTWFSSSPCCLRILATEKSVHGRERSGCFGSAPTRCGRFQGSNEPLRVLLVIHTNQRCFKRKGQITFPILQMGSKSKF